MGNSQQRNLANFYILYSQKEDIKYIREYPIKVNNKNYRFDFFLPHYNIIIEYNGEQHYKAFEYFGGEEKLLKTQASDKTKKQYCIDNDIKLIIFTYNQNEEEIKKQLGLMFNDYPEKE